MRKALVALLVALAAPAAQASQPTEATLLAAWEAAQRSDPRTVALEKVGERRYRFETTRFPFKGELTVASVNLEDVDLPDGDGSVMGAVEVELVGAPADLASRHSLSYGAWQAGNVMYFDRKADRWLTSREWQRSLQRRYSPWSGLLSIGNLLFIGLLLFLIVVLGRLSRKASTQYKAAMSAQEQVLARQEESMALARRSLELSEESTALLRGILAELKARRST
jgi:hypothetical protein